MDIIYLPSTYISLDSAEKILEHFDKIVIYQSFSHSVSEFMQNFIDNEKIELRDPIKGNKEKILKTLEEYRNLYRGDNRRDINLIKEHKQVPLFDKDSAFMLKQEIKKEQKSIEDDTFIIQLFFFMNYEYDNDNSQVNDMLDRIGHRKQIFLNNLKGRSLEEKVLQDYITRDKEGIYDYEKRLRAWSYFFLNDEKKKPNYFVTDKKEVFNYIKNTQNEVKLDESLIDKEAFDICQLKGSFNKYIKKEESINDFFLLYLK